MLDQWINLNKTQKIRFFKVKLNKGLCRSLKTERNEDFNDFMELFKYHPESDIKLCDVIDICIVSNKKNKKYFELNLIKLNGKIEDISYIICINKRNNIFNLNSAMRYAIEPQIKDYRYNNEMKCSYCKSINNIHIDHIIMFKNLVKDFLEVNLKQLPVDFDDNEFNGSKFKLKDKSFEEDWFIYHKNNAKLQCLCSQCNLTRLRF